MANFKRAKEAALKVPELKAELERYLNLSRAIYEGDVIALSSEIRKGIVDIYTGPGPHLVLEWRAWDRLAAKQDAKALANAIAAHHRKKYPHLYKQ